MKKVLIITGISLVVIIAAISFAISPIAEWYVEKNSKELVGRKVTMDNLSVNIFSGRLQIEKFTMFEADDSSPFVTFDLFDVNVKMLGFLASKVNVEHVLLSGANIHVIQNGDYFNFNDIIDFFSSDSTKTEQDTIEESSDWDVVINDIHLDHSYLYYQDKEVGSEWNLKDISIVIPGIDLSDLQADMGLQLDFLNGGKLATNIKYDTEKSLYDLKLDIQNFRLTPILPYLQQSFNVDSLNGVFSTKLNIKGSTDHVMEFDVNGILNVADFQLKDSQNKNLLTFDSVLTEIKHIDLVHNNIELNTLHVNGLSSYYEFFKDSSDNFTLLFKEDSTQNVDTVVVQTEEEPMKILIRDLKINNAHFDYIDNTLPQTFKYAINDICVSAENFTLANKNNVTLSALLQQSGKLKVKWIGSLEDMSNQNITISLNNLDLQSFTPYSLALFGNPITDGHISIQSQNIIVNNMLRGTNKVNIFNPKIGEKNKDIKAEYNIPLKMGIYVLTDKNGKVDLDLPVSGNVESPDFSYKKIIFKTLGNLLVKVAASPFNALKSSDDNLSQILISSTATEFTDEEYAKFGQIGALQQEKPELKLYVTQEILYSSAIKEYCLLELKKNMAIQDPTNQITEDNANDLLVREKYSAIPNKSPELQKFADEQMTQKGLKITNKQSIEQKAIALYEQEMKTTILKDMNWRNTLLHTYLTKQCSLSDTTVSISSYLIENDTSSNFKDNYRIDWKLTE